MLWSVRVEYAFVRVGIDEYHGYMMPLGCILEVSNCTLINPTQNIQFKTVSWGFHYLVFQNQYIYIRFVLYWGVLLMSNMAVYVKYPFRHASNHGASRQLEWLKFLIMEMIIARAVR